MSVAWVLVADRARARLFSLTAGVKTLEEVQDFINTEADVRAARRERPPRAQDRMGAHRHAIEPHTSPEAKSAARFARDLAATLDSGRVARRYRGLVLMAPPRFLGALNAAIGKQVSSLLVSEVAKNLTCADPGTIYAELPDALLRNGGLFGATR